MLTLSAQSETVSLVNDFNDLSIRNDVSYGAHKVSMQMMMTSLRSSTCCVILKIELELEIQHSGCTAESRWVKCETCLWFNRKRAEKKITGL